MSSKEAAFTLRGEENPHLVRTTNEVGEAGEASLVQVSFLLVNAGLVEPEFRLRGPKEPQTERMHGPEKPRHLCERYTVRWRADQSRQRHG